MTSLTRAASPDLPTAELVASLLREGLEVQLRLSGWSMKPLLRSGCSVRFTARGRPALGDIALVRYPNNQLVAHRVVAVDGPIVRTKGDSCLLPDGPVPSERVLGYATSLKGSIEIPLRNVWMRRAGLLVNRTYPALVRFYRRVLPKRDATFVEAN